MKDKLPLNADSFKLFNNYYDLIYHEKGYEKEAQYVINLLQSHNAKMHPLLELGFGTGNYTKHISKAGYKITGIEKSKQMVELATAKAIPHFLPIVDDITTFKIDKKFNAVISLFHVMSYLTENKKIVSCLKQVFKHLHKKGIFIFDVWYSPAVYTQKPRNSIKNINTDLYEVTRKANPCMDYEKNIVEVNYQLDIKNKITRQHDVLKETHYMRHFSTPEIKLMAKLAGFKVVKCEEFLTAKPPSENTWGVCYILQKDD